MVLRKAEAKEVRIGRPGRVRSGHRQASSIESSGGPAPVERRDSPLGVTGHSAPNVYREERTAKWDSRLDGKFRTPKPRSSAKDGLAKFVCSESSVPEHPLRVQNKAVLASAPVHPKPDIPGDLV
ncbi:hypothetical protein PM082_010302 [Marasmius tenuissimus]|nr:hypothetical protein PM082_010302 [Marasmius tenuissimus]